MNHHATRDFWDCYNALPPTVRELADKSFALLKADSQHPSLHFKKIGRFRSVRVSRNFRALGVEQPDGVLWFWIGSHADYDKLIVRRSRLP